MTQQSSSASSSSVASTLAGMGLFLATAAVSQWIRIHHVSRLQKQEQQHQQESTDDRVFRQHYSVRRRKLRRRQPSNRRDASRSSTSSYEDWQGRKQSKCSEDCENPTERQPPPPRELQRVMSKEAFRRRKIARRLSFDQFVDGNSNDGSNSPQTFESSSGRNRDDRFNRKNRRRRGSKQRLTSSAREAEAETGIRELANVKDRPLPFCMDREVNKRASSCLEMSHRSDVYHDFHPKYQNWRHFEHCNEHDRAKQRRKSSMLRLQQQNQQQQRSGQQQDAGEGASQKEVENIKPATIPQHRHVDNGSDMESVSTFFNESDNDHSDEFSNSSDSYGSGNQFVWTRGHASKYHRQGSSKSDCFTESYHNQEQSIMELKGDGIEALSRMAEDATRALHPSNPLPMNVLSNDWNTDPPGRSQSMGALDSLERTKSGSNNSGNVNHANADNRIGKFERFYRMLTSSIIDDDSSNRIEGSNSERNLGISLSSSSAHYNSSLEFDGDMEDQHRALRTEYNAQIMPEKLVLIRHGQSMGNVDETIYATTPDNAMPLTDLGWEQARKAGTILKDTIINPGESVHFIVSPYVRTVETFHGIVSAWCNPESEEFSSIKDHNRKVNAWYERLTELGLTWNEDSRIREQDFGNYQTPEVTKRAKEERHRFGAFYYRFNNGESGSDVFDRVSTFLDSLWRSFETNKSQNYVLVTHGIVLRVLMARYFRYTISQLNMLANPRNCEMVVLGHDGDGRLDLEGRCALELEEDPETHRPRIKGHRFHKRLRILPKSHVRTVRFRISPQDHKV